MKPTREIEVVYRRTLEPAKAEPAPRTVSGTERLARACGHEGDFKILADEPNAYAAGRRKKWSSKMCAECAAAHQKVPARSRIVDVQRVLVTPEVAAEMLTKNTRNREIVEASVEQFADLLRRGEFEKFTGKPNRAAVSFASDGVLRDGQHRLTAIVRSGVATEMYVAHAQAKALNRKRARRLPIVQAAREIARLLGETTKEAFESICALVAGGGIEHAMRGIQWADEAIAAGTDRQALFRSDGQPRTRGGTWFYVTGRELRRIRQARKDASAAGEADRHTSEGA